MSTASGRRGAATTTDRLGTGPECPGQLSALLRTCEQLSHRDSCSGYLFASGLLSTTLRWAPEHVREHVGSPRLLTGSIQPAGTLRSSGGEYVVAGCWPAVPVAAEADWFALAVRRHGDEGPMFVLLPSSAVDVGAPIAAGSGSEQPRQVLAADVTVTADYLIPAFGRAPQDEPARPGPALALRTALTGAALGLARQALHEFTDTARHKSRIGERERMAEQPLLRTELNRVTLAFRAGRGLALDELAALTDRRGPLSISRRAVVAAALLHAQRVSADAVRFAFGKAGGTALFRGHPLEVCWRISEELSSHHVFGERAEREIVRAQFGDFTAPEWL